MHGLWNGSSLLGVEAYFGVYVLWMVPIFGLVIWLGVASRRKEQRIVAEKLPGMVAAGLVTPNEATWLGSIRNRKAAIGQATRVGGTAAAKAVKNFAAPGGGAGVRPGPHRPGLRRPAGERAAERGDLRRVRERGRPRLRCRGWPATARRLALVRRGVPAAAVADRYLQRHVQRVGAAHLVAHQLLDLVPFPRRDLEQQFVVHLQQHP